MCLSNNDLEDDDVTRDAQQNDTYVGRCITEVHAAGLPSSAPVVAYGHSYGGVLVLGEVKG